MQVNINVSLFMVFQKGLPPKQGDRPLEEPKEEAAAGIDPVMQKYMEMVKQQKEKEKAVRIF